YHFRRNVIYGECFGVSICADVYSRWNTVLFRISEAAKRLARHCRPCPGWFSLDATDGYTRDAVACGGTVAAKPEIVLFLHQPSAGTARLRCQNRVGCPHGDRVCPCFCVIAALSGNFPRNDSPCARNDWQSRICNYRSRGG